MHSGVEHLDCAERRLRRPLGVGRLLVGAAMISSERILDAIRLAAEETTRVLDAAAKSGDDNLLGLLVSGEYATRLRLRLTMIQGADSNTHIAAAIGALQLLESTIADADAVIGADEEESE